VKTQRKQPDHPTYKDMITTAIVALKERTGSSRQAIVKYVIAHYKVDPDKAGVHVKTALKRMVSSDKLKQMKGTGASGSFKLNKQAAEPKPKVKKSAKAKKPAAKKPAAKKAAAKPKTKKVVKKKAASPKKTTKKPAPKKPSSAAKKAAAKPKKAKKPAPKKAAVKKSPAKAKGKAKKPAAKKSTPKRK